MEEINNQNESQDKMQINPMQTDVKNQVNVFAVGVVIAVLLGGLSGFGIYKLNAEGGGVGKAPTTGEVGEIEESKIKAGEVYGFDDELFKDVAEGTIEEGGSNGEGTHKLLREGGEDQTAYLTSSVLDLDSFVGRKVKVWGQTFASQKVGWLMDIGKIEVLE
jgi:nucleoid DNA-binding protein